MGLPLRLDPRDIQARGRPGVAEADFLIYPHRPTGMDTYGVIELKRPDSVIITETRKDILILSRDAETAIAQAERDAAALRAMVYRKPDQLLVIGGQFHIFVIMGLSHMMVTRFRSDFARSQLERRMPPGLQIVPYDVLYQRFVGSNPPVVHILGLTQQ
jgi:hypothetical protein